MKCPYCNAEIEDHLVFCPSCGAKLVNEDAGSTQQPETSQPQAPVQQPETVQQPYNNGQQNYAGQQSCNNGQQNYAGQQSYNNGQQNYAGQQPYNNGQQNYAGQQPYNNGQQNYAGQQPYNNGQQNYAGQQYNNGQQYYNGQPGYQQYGPDMMWPVKSKTVAGILGILLGDLGVHKFYLGNVGLGIVYLLFCWTGIPGIIGFIEGIIYLTSSRADFEMKNHVRCSDTSE